MLEEAEERPEWRPVGLYSGETAVGFAMYGFFMEEEGGRVWLDRFLIDERFQGMGCGGTGLKAILSRLRAEYGERAIFLSLYSRNKRALALYEKHGFRLNGETDVNGELVMILECGQRKKEEL